ncbi:pathogenesis-related protein STH-2-like [Andrographis paniculata]|uniref:pathogenesis-related protein STH-2-like n=1 Tax=Andrographis paniculata TaxID=175694 RepID=UPI0021E71246|nr:pathogenesis-related protein STH-2-like [Andrographis paniculata]
MGIKTFFHELKTKVSPSRLFKATITDAHDILPKACPDAIKSLEVVEGGSLVSGHTVKTIFAGPHMKHAKTKFEHIDPVNYTCKNTWYEGDGLGDKVEKISYDIKFEASDDGGCVVKMKSDYHTKGDYDLTDDEINDFKEQVFGLYKTCEVYLIDNPHACT